MTVLYSILIFLLVIVFHEFGHFMVAKLVGVRVNEFSIGMGPLLAKKQGPETKYSLRAIPIGGYVAMEGEEESSEDPRSYSRTSVGRRLLIIVAGAMMNFVFAFLVLLFIFGMRGQQVPVIAEFTPNSPLKAAGFQIEDRIINIGEESIEDWNDLLDSVAALIPGEEVEVTAQRGEETVIKLVTPIRDDETGRLQIGIVAKTEKNVADVFRNTTHTFWVMLTAMFRFFEQLFRGSVGLGDLSGPVGIVTTIGQASQAGLYPVLMLLALINVNVGFFNLLPVPALDGGKIIFLLFEAIRGRPVPQEKESMVHFIGFVLLMLLILVVTFKDVLNLGFFGG